MDIVSHALWAGAGAEVLGHKVPMDRKARWQIVALAAAPDIVPLLPLIAWALAGTAPLALIYSYIVATPASEPSLPPLLTAFIHHLHCTMHSAIVVAGITIVAWVVNRAFPLVLLGWWSHVLLDIPTHSADYYKVSALYPFADIGFDGVAWTDPGFLAINYSLLALVYLLLTRSRVLHLIK